MSAAIDTACVYWRYNNDNWRHYHCSNNTNTQVSTRCLADFKYLYLFLYEIIIISDAQILLLLVQYSVLILYWVSCLYWICIKSILLQVVLDSFILLSAGCRWVLVFLMQHKFYFFLFPSDRYFVHYYTVCQQYTLMRLLERLIELYI